MIAPCALLALGDWRPPRHWLAVGTPGALYVLVVDRARRRPRSRPAARGAARSRRARPRAVRVDRTILGLVLGGLVGWLPRLARRRALRVPSQWSMLAPGLVMVAPLGLLTTAISGSYAHYARVSAFVLFGVALGRASALIADRNRTAARAAFLVLTLAWASSVSLGYATPAYASGMLAALILLLDYPASPRARAGRWIPLAGLTAVTAVAFVAARTQVVYREQAAARLDRPLGDVFAGGAGIRTNPQTHAFLADLSQAVAFARARARPYAIVPDLPGHWATSRQPNPLPIDWPQSIELHAPALAARVMRSLDEQRGVGLVLVQKVRADLLATAMVPLTGEGIYPLVTTIRATRTKIGETAFFEIYE